PWLVGERIDNETYPFAQRVGPVWLVAVNSATANRWPWDARGAVGAAQLERLVALLDRLDGGPRILVTPYPRALPTGRCERRAPGRCAAGPLVWRPRAAGGCGGARRPPAPTPTTWYRPTWLPSRSSVPAAPRSRVAGPTASTPSAAPDCTGSSASTISTRVAS